MYLWHPSEAVKDFASELERGRERERGRGKERERGGGGGEESEELVCQQPVRVVYSQLVV